MSNTDNNARSIPAVHVRMKGYSAFFRNTALITGNQLTLPCPTYANLLGLLSACAGKTVCPTDTRIGFEFNHASEDEDLERTDRLALTEERLSKHRKGKGVLRRQVHFRPTLDLYLNNLALAEAFRNPIGTPCLGRSQDLCWITKVEPVTLTPVASGRIGATMIGRHNRVLDPTIPSEIVVTTEWFTNDLTGYTRAAQATGYYQVIGPDDISNQCIQVTIDNLHHPSNLPEGDVIYLHEWFERKGKISEK